MNFASQHAALNGGADGDDFVWVHALVRLFAEHFMDEFLHLGDAGGTADEHDFVDVFGLHLRVFNCLLHGAAAAFDQISSSCSNFDRVMLICKCFGPLASAVMNGRLMSVELAELSSFLAFSQAS